MAQFDLTFIDGFILISRHGQERKFRCYELYTNAAIHRLKRNQFNETGNIPKCRSFAKINVNGGPKQNSTKS